MRRNGRTWWWKLMVFCSQEFVVALCKYYFFTTLFFVSVLRAYSRASLISDITVSRNSTASRESYIPTIDCLSLIVEFCEQSNLNPLTRTQVHGYILQVVNFHIFYYRLSFRLLIVNSFSLFISMLKYIPRARRKIIPQTVRLKRIP